MPTTLWQVCTSYVGVSVATVGKASHCVKEKLNKYFVYLQRTNAVCFVCYDALSPYKFSPRSVTKSRIPDVSLWMFVKKKKALNMKVHWISLQENRRRNSCFKLLWYSCHRKTERWDRNCASVLFHQEGRGMDINRSRYLQKWWARCAVLYLSSQILKTASDGDTAYRSIEHFSLHF